MEFTLYLVSKNPLEEEKQNLLLEEAKNMAGQNIEGVFSTTSEIRYDNRLTGVHFQIYYAAEGQNVTSGEKVIPEDIYDTGLAFKIPFFKGVFFAYEALWLITKLCNNYQLQIVNPHRHSAEPEVSQQNFNEIIDDYKELNSKVSHELIKEEKFREIYYYLPEKKALQWWRFMFHKDYLEETYQKGEGIFVPSLMLLNNPQNRNISRAFIMKTGLITLFPDADLVMVTDEDDNIKAWKTEAFIKKAPGPVKQIEFQNSTYTAIDLKEPPREGDKNKPIGTFDDYSIIPSSSVLTEDLRELLE